MSLENPKVWLCLITSDTEHENVEELTRIWQDIDGICAVVHKQGGTDAVKNIIESRKKEGFVIERAFNFHHGHAMNEWLFDKRIELGDVCIIRDSCERLDKLFTKNIRYIVDELYKQNICNIYQKGKLLIFRRWFNQQFFNGLHWGLAGLYGGMIDIKHINKLYEDDINCAYSLRNVKRPPDHHIFHEVRYLLDYSVNGNHLQLYHNNPSELDAHQKEFYKFLEYLKQFGIKDAEGLKLFLTGKKEITEELKYFLNLERPLKEAYRAWGLGHTHDDIIANRDTYKIE